MQDILPHVHAVLVTTAGRLLALTEKLPEEVLVAPPTPGEWSPRECLAHLLQAEQDIFPVRVRAFLAGQDFASFDPDQEGSTYPGRSTSQLAADFARRRAENLADLEALSTGDLERTARHSELGQVTLGQLLHEWAAHDLSHTMQAERALMQPFIAGCGPWHIYFTEHKIGS